MSGINDLAEERGLMMAAAFIEDYAEPYDEAMRDIVRRLRQMTPVQKNTLRYIIVEQQRKRHFVE